MTKVWESDAIANQGDLCILLALADWADDEGSCWPSLRRLAKKARAHKATIIRRLADMRGHWVEWKDNDGGRNRRNRYTLILDNLSVPLPAKPKGSHHATVSEPDKGSHHATVSDAERVASCDDKGSHSATRNNTSVDTSEFKNTASPHRGGGSEERASAREETAPSTTDEKDDAIDWGWMPEGDRVYLPTIAEKCRDYRPTSGRELLIHTWRRRADIPDAALVGLIQSFPWPVFVAAVVIAADDDRPNLKFLSAILRRLNHEYATHAAGRADDATAGDGSGSGIPVPYAETGHGRALPDRVRPRCDGGRAAANGYPPPNRRRGESSPREFLLASGFDADKVAALSDEEIEAWLFSPIAPDRG